MKTTAETTQTIGESTHDAPQYTAPEPESDDRRRWSIASVISILSLCGIGAHLLLRYVFDVSSVWSTAPLIAVLVIGGIPLVVDLSRKLLRGEFGSDLLAGISVVTSVLLGEYLVGCVIVLMLSGGGALEQFAKRRASSVLRALAKRMPQKAHRRSGQWLAD